MGIDLTTYGKRDAKLISENEEQKEAHDLTTMFKLVGLNINAKTAYIIKHTCKKYFEVGMEFSIKDATKIEIEANKLFE